MISTRKVVVTDDVGYVQDDTAFFGSPSYTKSFLSEFMKTVSVRNTSTLETILEQCPSYVESLDHDAVDVPLLSQDECALKQRAVRKHQVETLQYFSNKHSLTPKLVEKDDDELQYYDTKHDGYEFKVLASEPVRSQMKPNVIYMYNASDRRIAYKTFAPHQEHVSHEDKKIVKDYISTDKLSEFKYPLTPINLSPCLENIIDITKERGHTPGYGEYSFELAFKA